MKSGDFPALRLLAGHIDALDDRKEKLRRLEWLVGTLNPTDNQGLREQLLHLLIGQRRAGAERSLPRRYSGRDVVRPRACPASARARCRG